MFKRHIVATSLLLVVTAVISVMAVLTYSEAEYKALQEMLGANDQDQELRPLRQQRLLVRRDVRGGGAASNKNIVLFGNQADLVLDLLQKEAVENLLQPRAYVQEHLTVDAQGLPQQVLRYMQAEQGTYYHQQQFVHLNDVFVAQFAAVGHQILDGIAPIEPPISGHAKSAKVFLTEGPRFEVSDLEGSTATGMRVKAKHADYDGNKLDLLGEVILKGPFGEAQADTITLLDPAEGTFRKAQLRDDVVITTSTGSRLVCDQGDIDLEKGKAVFTTKGPLRMVVWQENSLDGVSTQVECRCLTAHFGGASDRSHELSEVIADDHVTVTREGHWIAKGDKGTFVRSQESAKGGLITLVALEEGHVCTIVTPEGDRLNALRIFCNTEQSTVSLQHVNGQLSRGGKANISFAAKEAHWSDPEGVLVLKDGAIIEDAMGHLENDEMVKVYLQKIGDSRELTKIEALGFTLMTKRSEISPQTLTCQGGVLVDHIAQHAVFSSPTDANGDTPRSEQVSFKDASAEMHADALVVDYAFADGQVSPAHVVADGNVCLKGHLGTASENAGARYALCDILEYWPDKQSVLLSAKTGRVALLDGPNGVAVSSPAVRVHRDPTTHKEIIKGLGDVRFSLLDREYQRLKERFNTDLSELP